MTTIQTLLALVGLIYVLCVIVQAVQEVVKSALNTKAKTMAHTINEFMGAHLPLDDVKKALTTRGLDLTALEHFNKDDFRHLLDGIESLAPKLKGIVATDTATFEQEKDNVAASYEAARAKFQAAYARKNKLFALGFSFLIVIALDANLIAIYQELAADQVMAQGIAAKAVKATCGSPAQADSQKSTDLNQTYESSRDCIKQTLKSYPILVRWSQKAGKMWVPMWWWGGKDWDEPFAAIVGILVMGSLVSLGAPFWNDVLKGITGINNSLNTGGGKKSQ